MLTTESAAFALAYLTFSVAGAQLGVLAFAFVAAGIGIGCVETAEHSAVVRLAPEALAPRRSACSPRYSLGNFAASASAGLLWTAVSPTAAFVYLACWMLVALVAFAATQARRD